MRQAFEIFVDVLIAHLVRMVPFDVWPHRRLKDFLPTYGAWYVGRLMSGTRPGGRCEGVWCANLCGVLICVVNENRDL